MRPDDDIDLEATYVPPPSNPITYSELDFEPGVLMADTLSAVINEMTSDPSNAWARDLGYRPVHVRYPLQRRTQPSGDVIITKDAQCRLRVVHPPGPQRDPSVFSTSVTARRPN